MSSVALHTAVYVTTSSLKQLGWHFWYGSEIQDDYQQLLYSVQIVHEWYLECPNQSFRFIMNWQDGLCHRANIRIWCLRGKVFFDPFLRDNQNFPGMFHGWSCRKCKICCSTCKMEIVLNKAYFLFMLIRN